MIFNNLSFTLILRQCPRQVKERTMLIARFKIHKVFLLICRKILLSEAKLFVYKILEKCMTGCELEVNKLSILVHVDCE